LHFLIDGYNLAYRSALVNTELANSQGEPSGMVFGFLRTLNTLKKRFSDYKFVVVWDERPQWKYDLFPKYKDGRASSLPDLIRSEKRGDGYQMRALKAALRVLDVDQCSAEGEEADDGIATLSQLYKRDGLVYVYTNDKDMLALVENNRVVVMRPKVGMTPEKMFSEEDVEKKFGVRPSQLIEFRSFDGDASDALPGVPKVPRKIIRSLLEKYGTVEGVYLNLPKENLTKFQKNAMLVSEVQVSINKKIMSLNDSLENLEFVRGVRSEESCEESESENRLARILDYYNLRSLKPDKMLRVFWSQPKVGDPDDAVEIATQTDLFDD